MNHKNRLSLGLKILVLLALTLSACETATQTPLPTTQPARPAATSVPVSATPTPAKLATKPPVTIELPIVTHSTPARVEDTPKTILSAVLMDLEKRTGSQPGNLTILRSEEVTWNDGSLGCPKPGMMYTMATVEGYWLVVQVNTKVYDYRINGNGLGLMLCEK